MHDKQTRDIKYKVFIKNFNFLYNAKITNLANTQNTPDKLIPRNQLKLSTNGKDSIAAFIVETLNVETLDSLCNYFDCEIEDIIKHIKN